jgi:hypothetical protein
MGFLFMIGKQYLDNDLWNINRKNTAIADTGLAYRKFILNLICISFLGR